MNNNLLEKLIENGIKQELEIEFDKALENLVKTINSRRHEIIGSVMASVSQNIAMEFMGNEFRVIIKIAGGK